MYVNTIVECHMMDVQFEDMWNKFEKIAWKLAHPCIMCGFKSLSNEFHREYFDYIWVSSFNKQSLQSQCWQIFVHRKVWETKKKIYKSTQPADLTMPHQINLQFFFSFSLWLFFKEKFQVRRRNSSLNATWWILGWFRGNSCNKNTMID